MDRDWFFNRNPGWRRHYADRFLCSAMCQGAALHYYAGDVGINDFDLYNFFVSNPRRRSYALGRKIYDFGGDRFGQTVDRPTYLGRRVDVMGRALDVEVGADPVEAVQIYLQAGRTKTSRLLAEKAVVLLEPVELMGKVAWPI